MFVCIYIIRASTAFGCARSASRRKLGNAGWVAPVIYRHLDGSIYIGCMESARWVTPAESATIVCAGLVIYMSMQELTFPAADPGHGPLECGSSVQFVVHQAGQTWQSASVAVSCWCWATAHAGVKADLGIRICHCTACCWRWAATHAGFRAALSVLWLSCTRLQMEIGLS